MDALTKLLDNGEFEERAAPLLAHAYAQGKTAALLLVDLDNVRLLNESYGQRAGDQMLVTVGTRIRSALDPASLVARRGDEFRVLLHDVVGDDALAVTARELLAVIEAPVAVFGVDLSVTASIGIAVQPRDGTNVDALLQAADLACGAAKRHGKRAVAFYGPEHAREVELRRRLVRAFGPARDTRDFQLFYDLRVSLSDGKLVGARCVPRWRDPELGVVEPEEFLPVAAAAGLRGELGNWVLREACRARRTWRERELDMPPLSVVVASSEVEQPGFVDAMMATLSAFGVAPREIEIELDIGPPFASTDIGRDNLLRLRGQGVGVAVDRFGSGYSSLSHLREWPIQRLVIDRVFMINSMKDGRTMTIVRAMIRMAQSLGIEATAAGVQTEAQMAWMDNLGCSHAHGDLFAPPMSAENFAKCFDDGASG